MDFVFKIFEFLRSASVECTMKAFLLTTFGALVFLIPNSKAVAHDRDREYRELREREWREHEWREREYREHHHRMTWEEIREWERCHHREYRGF